MGEDVDVLPYVVGVVVLWCCGSIYQSEIFPTTTGGWMFTRVRKYGPGFNQSGEPKIERSL
jgi:hypothetical protein